MANILIVDDSRTSRKILREVLEKAGHTVIGEGVNGEEGVALFKELTPDIVTLDITMPIMNGLEALEAIMKENSDAKVIMITAAGQREKMVQSIKQGATDFISKPFEPEQIVETIKHVLVL